MGYFTEEVCALIGELKLLIWIIIVILIVTKLSDFLILRFAYQKEFEMKAIKKE